MARLTTKIIIATALLATAACTTKRREELPPAPVGSYAPAPQPQGPTGTDVIPGSAADFMRSVAGDTIRFALDQFDIDAGSRATLDSQSVWLARYPNVRITIEGHCDERGTREYNLALGIVVPTPPRISSPRAALRRSELRRSAMGRSARSRLVLTTKAGRKTGAR